VSLAPVIPALNDEEIPAILEAAAAAGAQFAGSTVVRLPFAVKDIFASWLEEHFPQRAEKVLGRIRSMQGETLSHGEFGKRLRGEGIWAEQIRALFQVSKKRNGLDQPRPPLNTKAFRRPSDPSGQMDLVFD
jgi:DNA repair photolyase